MSLTIKLRTIFAAFAIAIMSANTAMTAQVASVPFERSASVSVRIAQASTANGYNATVVYYEPAGSFRQTNEGQWLEQNTEGSFSFVETLRDEWSVYLYDASRNVRIQLDLFRMLVLYAAGDAPMQPLYQISGADAGQQDTVSQDPPPGHIVEYTCNEGIPLIVTYVFVGSKSYALFSHDGFPEIRVDSVPSGSGTKYSNGRYTLRSKGDDVYLEWDGIEDFCVKN
jgi:membrane-bound inhibitor of C-type lysozyme